MLTSGQDDADDTTESDSADEVDDSSDTKLTWSPENWLLIGIYFGLTLVGMLISAGVVQPELLNVSNTSSGAIDRQSSVKVPLYVYLYASLGALGYIFTRLITQLDTLVEWGNIEDLVEMGLRIPAAWILAAGVFLFLPLFSAPVENVGGPWLAAGMAFLVGLYVNVAFKSLGGLAERLLGRTAKSESEGDETGTGGSSTDSGKPETSNDTPDTNSKLESRNQTRN